jgi:excisionase family DNA binding protein
VNPTDDLPRVLTIPEAARVLRVSRGVAYEAARTGEIPTVRIGRRILVPTSRLLALIDGDAPEERSTEAP